ncbi:class I SAM-dependent methyltransferase [Paenibacillus radicis (ex Xue et al. 2023)]|uniref:Methyltransferase domain-containing protein n=1 Tax=Paenibacillus radicis (ex Xue et al. 2023) TaxID=2972489 RepID=A0ABT1YSG5_9BACL|nr:class I SAM-dependent methyltransferase [Paenibacillus radicis (ex Xue et al. 2023)]MCR8634920.1 methyltransferase domain-containing protein [Paenibacillus radicis (ex Xue et al. 2023)]
MTMDFHDSKHSHSYTSRAVNIGWLEQIASTVNLKGTKAADIGCGGGIYSKALAALGAVEVTGVDFSQAMLAGAVEHCSGFSNVHFFLGHALHTGLADSRFDVVLERALIHHLTADQLTACFIEAYRVLDQGGTLLVQDRTPEDCLLAGGLEHLRGYFFERFPRLIEKETVRRHSSSAVCDALAAAGFVEQEQIKLWETRQMYSRFSDFRSDLLKRTGRTLLHELDDMELLELADFIQEQTGYKDEEAVEEKDRWTLWIARKH